MHSTRLPLVLGRNPHPSRGRQQKEEEEISKYLKTQPTPLTGTATSTTGPKHESKFWDATHTPHGDGNHRTTITYQGLMGRNPHPSRGRQHNRYEQTVHHHDQTQPTPLTGTATGSADLESLQIRSTQPTPLTGTATTPSSTRLVPLLGRNPHPSRGRQLIEQGVHHIVVILTQPTPLTGTATTYCPSLS